MAGKCILGCNDLGYADVVTHFFPNPDREPERFQQWVNIVGGLFGETKNRFYTYKRICDIHFSNKFKSRYNRLCATAVPTLHLKGITEKIKKYRSNSRCPRSYRKDKNLDSNNTENKTSHHSNVEQLTDVTMFENTGHKKKEVTDTNYQVHEGHKCNLCLEQIIGFRYVCVECTDWDMCGSCEARGAHRQHYVLRLPGPRPCAELQSVLECIRRELFKPQVVSDNSGIKLEDDIEIEYVPSQQQLATEHVELSSDEETLAENKYPPPKINDETNCQPNQQKITTKLKTFKVLRKVNTTKPFLVKHSQMVNINTLNKLGIQKNGLKKMENLIKLKLPVGLELEAFHKSLKKDLVVNLKRLTQPQPMDTVVKVEQNDVVKIKTEPLSAVTSY